MVVRRDYGFQSFQEILPNVVVVVGDERVGTSSDLQDGERDQLHEVAGPLQLDKVELLTR